MNTGCLLFDSLQEIWHIAVSYTHLTVAFQITDDALGFYDNEMNYMVEPGDFVFMVGGSSDDVQQITYNLKE